MVSSSMKKEERKGKGKKDLKSSDTKSCSRVIDSITDDRSKLDRLVKISFLQLPPLEDLNSNRVSQVSTKDSDLHAQST